MMVGPSLLLWAVFLFAPIAVSAGISLFSWDLLTPPRWVGGANYRALASSGALLQATVSTLELSVLVVLGSVSLGLSLALLLNRSGRLAALVRGAVFSSYVVSWVSVALLWMWLLEPSQGLVSVILRWLHMAPSQGLLAERHWALPTLAAITVWKTTGYAMILFLAGLQDIPRSLHEAAALDGARAWQRFWHVTWPLLRPSVAFVATTSLVTSFQTFDVVRIMTQGGPAGATTVLVYAIYEQVFLDLRLGRASALTVIFFVVLLALTALQMFAWRARAPRTS